MNFFSFSLMEYLSVGEPEIGMKVVPIFNTTKPSYTILDLSWIRKEPMNRKSPKDFQLDKPPKVLKEICAEKIYMY